MQNKPRSNKNLTGALFNQLVINKEENLRRLLLKMLECNQPTFTVRELATYCGFKYSTTYEYANTLRYRGLVSISTLTGVCVIDFTEAGRDAAYDAAKQGELPMPTLLPRPVEAEKQNTLMEILCPPKEEDKRPRTLVDMCKEIVAEYDGAIDTVLIHITTHCVEVTRSNIEVIKL